MRIFIAIELPDELKRALGSLRLDMPGIRRVPVGQLHLTLAFLGEVEEAALECLIRALANIRAPAFTLCFSGTGCFPDRRRPRVLWAGLEPHPDLKRLADSVRSAVNYCGIPLEERPFSPHITVARLKLPSGPEFDSFLEQHKKLKLPPFSVREFILFQSCLAPQGALHTPLRSFSLMQ